MSRYSIRVTRLARQQLQGISEHIICEYKAPETARNMLRSLKNAIASLSEMPSRAKPIDEQPWGNMGVRKISYKNYYIYFWINENEKTVQITGVIYAGRDQTRQLNEMGKDN